VAAPISPFNAAAVLEAAIADAASTSPLAGLQSGAVIAARVLSLLENGAVQLAIGNARIEATTQVPLRLGATVQLAVRSTDNGVTLQFVGQVAPEDSAPQAVTPPADAPSVSMRQPAVGQAAVAQGSQGAVTAPPVAGAIVVPRTGDPTAAVAAGAEASARSFITDGAAAAALISTTSVAAGAPAGTSLVALQELPVTVAPQLVPATGVDPAVALRVAVRSAAVSQKGLSPLYAEIAAAVDLPSLPEPVLREALRLLSLRPPLDGNLSAENVRQVFVNSGLFLEAQLADGAKPSPDQPANAGADFAPTAAEPTPAAASAPPAGDLKAALIVFRQVLAMALADGSFARNGAVTSATALADATLRPAQAPIPSESRLLRSALLSSPVQPASVTSTPALKETPIAPPPPFRGGPMTAQPPVSASIDAATPPQEAVQTLIQATDGALARQTLLQAASLPGASAGHVDSGGPRWNFEVPFAVPQGGQVVTNVAQFEISRDGRAATPTDGLGPVWRARFSVDIDPIGRVHAQVALRGVRAAVTLWAERPEGAARLRAGATRLGDALRTAELDAGDPVVRDGAPRSRAIAAGHFLDRAS